MRKIPVLFFALVLLGCEQSPPPETVPPTDQPAPQPTEPAAEVPTPEPDEDSLEAILEDQPEEVQARYEYRNPQETLEFLGVEPGMTVVEALPGMGWYSRILVPYLGEEGRLVGANYAQDMWPLFGFFDDEFIQSMETWTTDWPEEAEGWSEDGASVDAFEFGSMPVALKGQADAVLFIRAMHNLARFEGDGEYMTTALKDSFEALKPGGILGVVQHEARPEMPDEWATGANGYLKKEFVIDRVTEAGFELVDESDVNENPNDQPTEEDIVWRLPPSYMTSQEDPELREEMDAIGESNRMTLKFRKPEGEQAEEGEPEEE